jgi:glucosamine--fructose-6-phosphate aminotransferase (isomerizing)
MKNTDGRGEHTLREIRSQAPAWRGVIRRVEEKAKALRALLEAAEELVFCGCGSAFNISHAVAPFAQKSLGRTCRAVQSSDLMLYPEMFLNPSRPTLGVVISRSGSTTESVEALRTLTGRGCPTLAITCFGDSPMAREASEALVLEEASERSVTTTRSLTAMVLAGQCLAAAGGDDGRWRHDYARLPELFEDRLDRFEELGRSVSRDAEVEKYAFVGSGGLYGLAREAQLKVKEMVLLPSDSYVSLDYQHGPMSNVDGRMLVSVLVSEAGRPYDQRLARNMKTLGGRVFVLSERAFGFEDHADYLLELDSGLPEGVRDVLFMPALQFMAYYKSMALGQNPDRPHNLSYHVEVQPEG